MTDPGTHINRHWTTEDKAVTFAFELAAVETALLLSAEINWREKPDDVLLIQSRDIAHPIRFEHHFASGNFIRGYVKAVSFFEASETGDSAIWGDFHYRHRRLDSGHFEGVMFLFDKDPNRWQAPAPPDPPAAAEPPAPEPPQVLPPQPDRPVPAERENLFPYIYMRGWPQPRQDALERDFVFYRSGPNQDTLLKKLTEARQQNDARTQMETEARTFIEGGAPWQGQFVTNGNSLHPLLGSLSQAWPRLVPGRRAECAAQLLSFIAAEPAAVRQQRRQPAYAADLDRVWQSLFALAVIAGFRNSLADSLIGILLADHLLAQHLAPDDDSDAARLLQTHVVLPAPVFPLPGLPTQTPSGWIEPLAVGDLTMVRRNLLRYEPGEIAYIVNLLVGERKEIVRRKTETIRENWHEGSENRKHHSDLERETNENLREESKRTLARYLVKHNYDNFDTSYGPPTTAKLSGAINVATEPEAPENGEAAKFARTILGETANRIADSVQRQRSGTTLRETEERETSIYDNSNGQANLCGIFRWLNKVYQAEVIRYGSRLMVEFELRQPAARYLARGNRAGAKTGWQTLCLEMLGITSHEQITRENYARLAVQCGVEEWETPPEAERVVSATLQSQDEKSIELPKGYEAVKTRVSCALPPDANGPGVTGLVGGWAFQFKPGGETSASFDMNGEDGAVPLTLQGRGEYSMNDALESVSVTVEISCRPGDTLVEAWQIRSFNALNRVCRERHGSDAGARASAHTPVQPDGGQRVRDLLKQACLGLLLERRAPFPDKAPSQTEPGVSLAWRLLPFLDCLFEWSEMAFVFQGGTQAEAWPTNAVDAAGERGFADFVHADLARVTLPVLPGCNLAVLYYLTSGLIWTGNGRLTPVHEADLALASHLANLEDRDREGEETRARWELTLPTTMHVLDGSADFNRLAVAAKPSAREVMAC